MITKLLVAYDGSSQAEKAYSLALDIASKFSAQMIVLSVAQIPEPPLTIEKDEVLEKTRTYYQPYVKKMKEKAESAGIKPRFVVRLGYAADEIVNMAKDDGVDAIVMGHLGGSVAQRWLVGSVAKRVLSYAHCTVIIAR
jgi:nucleotide-binding universal stress UspA family protein